MTWLRLVTNIVLFKIIIEACNGYNYKGRSVKWRSKQRWIIWIRNLGLLNCYGERATCFSRGNYNYMQLQSTKTLTKVILAVKKDELPNLDSTDQVGIVGVC